MGDGLVTLTQGREIQLPFQVVLQGFRGGVAGFEIVVVFFIVAGGWRRRTAETTFCVLRDILEIGDTREGWMPSEEFVKTEYGKLNRILDGRNYYGQLDRSKLPQGSLIVPDPKDGRFGISKGGDGEPIGKVDLD